MVTEKSRVKSLPVCKSVRTSFEYRDNVAVSAHRHIHTRVNFAHKHTQKSRHVFFFFFWFNQLVDNQSVYF